MILKMASKCITVFGMYLSIAVMMAVFSATAHAVDILPAMVTPEAGQQYYTRYNFKFEKEQHSTTNYWRGELVPINTKVTLVSLGSKKMVLDVDGRKVKFVNAKKHTLRGMDVIASELLSPKKISLNRISSDLRDDLETGTLRLGMSKEQVLMTRGYPPRHQTSSTKSNTWVYWSSRFVQQTLLFRKGKLIEGRGVR